MTQTQAQGQSAVFPKGRLYQGTDLFRDDNPFMREVLRADPGRRLRVLALVDAGIPGVREALVPRIMAWFVQHADAFELVKAPMVLPGGEASKGDGHLVDQLWECMAVQCLRRDTVVLCIGGGAFLDWTGFAAATARGGMRIVRVPTTSMGQAEAGVALRNCVNRFRRKDWAVVRALPWAVVNDPAFLPLQDPEASRLGLAGALRIALTRDAALFDLMEARAEAMRRNDWTALASVVERSAQLHRDQALAAAERFEHAGPQVVDLGGWVAHKLEQISGFTFPHGAAVAVGIAMDTIYSVEKGLLAELDGGRILAVLRSCGFPCWSEWLDDMGRGGRPLFLKGLEDFREQSGGPLRLTLLRGIGRASYVDHVDETAVLFCREHLRRLCGD